MKIFLNKNKLLNFISNKKDLGFVPTMGALHKGHVSLLKRSIKESKKTIVTIFINKYQFNKKNDFFKYPKVLRKDIATLKKIKIDYLYLPSHNDIYPKGKNKKIIINKFSKILCGKFRPGHFESVVDVIERFIKIINPKRIYLGEKDMQQLIIIKDYLKKNYKRVKVVSCKTIRENNGVAFSSRNSLLSKKEFKISSLVTKFLLVSKIDILKNKIFISDIKKKLLMLGVKKIDYIKVLDINRILKFNSKKKKLKVFIAFYLGSTRLIDNI